MSGCRRLAVAASALCSIVLAVACLSTPATAPELGVGDSGLAPLATPLAVPTQPPLDIRTAQALELRRVRDEHSRLIASIPTPTPIPTISAAEIASRYLLDGDAPDPLPGLAADPSLGVWWYRTSPGDWTASRMREANPYTPLFAATDLRPQHGNFENGGLQETIAQLMGDELVRIEPEFQHTVSRLVLPMADRLGWEFVSPDLPVVRLWTSFTYIGPEDVVPVEYRMGGVLAFGVAEHRDPATGDVLYQYPVVSHWIGPVLVENAGPAS